MNQENKCGNCGYSYFGTPSSICLACGHMNEREGIQTVSGDLEIVEEVSKEDESIVSLEPERKLMLTNVINRKPVKLTIR